MRKLKALLLCILAAVTVASTVCAFAAETEPAPLQVVSVSPIVYSDNTDGTPQGESGHTAEIGIRGLFNSRRRRLRRGDGGVTG